MYVRINLIRIQIRCLFYTWRRQYCTLHILVILQKHILYKDLNVIKQFHSDLKDILSLAVKALGAEKKYQNGTYTQYDTR